MDLNLVVLCGRLASPGQLRVFESDTRLLRLLITVRNAHYTRCYGQTFSSLLFSSVGYRKRYLAKALSTWRWRAAATVVLPSSNGSSNGRGVTGCYPQASAITPNPRNPWW